MQEVVNSFRSFEKKTINQRNEKSSLSLTESVHNHE